MRVAGIALVALIFGTVSAGADTLVDWRYLPSGHEFSIDMHAQFDRDFHVGKERSTADYVLVDFLYTPGATIHGMFAGRSIEWLKLAKPLLPEAFDRAASDAVDGYLAGRFPDGGFTVGDRRKTRNAEGRLIYVFAAKGTANAVSAGWQGTVQIFDSGIALVSSIVSLNTNGAKFRPVDGVIDPALVTWAATIRPEK